VRCVISTNYFTKAVAAFSAALPSKEPVLKTSPAPDKKLSLRGAFSSDTDAAFLERFNNFASHLDKGLNCVYVDFCTRCGHHALQHTGDRCLLTVYRAVYDENYP
jgi:hypothetical protein